MGEVLELERMRWRVADLPDARLRAFTHPTSEGSYGQQRDFSAADCVAPSALPDLQIRLAEILGCIDAETASARRDLSAASDPDSRRRTPGR